MPTEFPRQPGRHQLEKYAAGSASSVLRGTVPKTLTSIDAGPSCARSARSTPNAASADG
jgi:hypothetical protein